MDSLESKSIADLPVELILSIFKFLDHKSRLSVSGVCRSWKALTDDNSFEWNLYLDPTFQGYVYSDQTRVRSNRRFTNICIKGDVRVPILLDFFTKHGHAFASTVTHIAISKAKFHVMEFNNLLWQFPNLQNLQLSSVKLLDFQRLNDDDKPPCEQLKKLSFCDGSHNLLLHCLTRSKLRTLICRQQEYISDGVHTFLSTQTELCEIDFCREASNSALKYGMGRSVAMPTLRKVALDYKWLSDFDHIVTLLLRKPNDYESVELGHIPGLLGLADIFENLKNLKTLHLMPGSISCRLYSGFALKPLQSVTQLRLYDGSDYGLKLTSIEEMTNKIIKNLPKLEDLELFVPYSQSYFHSITTNLKKLKSLTIRVTYNTNLSRLKFPLVGKLRINCFDYASNTQTYPSLAMVANGAKVINESVRSLTYEGVADEEFFAFVRNTFPKLEVLEVRSQLARIRGVIGGVRCIRYRETSFFTQPMRFGYTSS